MSSMTRLRRLSCIAAIGFVASALACGAIAAKDEQATSANAPPPALPADARSEAPPPPGLEPVPEPAADPELEPQVTIKRKGGDTVEEARVNGRLVWIKVTPSH